MGDDKKQDEQRPVPFAVALGGLGGELVALLVRGNPGTGRRLGIAAGALLAHPELRDKALAALAKTMKSYAPHGGEGADAKAKK